MPAFFYPYLIAQVPPTAANPSVLVPLRPIAVAADPLATAFERFFDPLDDHDMCIVCMEQPRDTICIPCGHVVMCGTCSAAVQARSNLCPMCTTGIGAVVTL